METKLRDPDHLIDDVGCYRYVHYDECLGCLGFRMDGPSFVNPVGIERYCLGDPRFKSVEIMIWPDGEDTTTIDHPERLSPNETK